MSSYANMGQKPKKTGFKRMRKLLVDGETSSCPGTGKVMLMLQILQRG